MTTLEPLTIGERNFVYAQLLLRWVRTVEQHGLTFERWLEQHTLPTPNR